MSFGVCEGGGEVREEGKEVSELVASSPTVKAVQGL